MSKQAGEIGKGLQGKKNPGLLETLYRERIKEFIYSAVEQIRDNVKEDALAGVIEFNENPFIDRVFGKLTYVDQRNDLRQVGKDRHQAEFKMYITVVD